MQWRTWMAWLGLLLVVEVASAQPPTPAAAPKAVAVVDGVTISAADLEAAMRTSSPMAVPQTEREKRQVRQRALNTLIDTVLLRQFLEAKTKPVPAAEVGRLLTEMETGLRKQDKSLAEFCQETNKSVEQLKAEIADHLRWNAYITSRIPNATLLKYYADNKDFLDGVTVRASHIVMRLPAGATQAEKDKTRATLEGLRKQLVTDPKTDFAELAKKYSQDVTAEKGGDLGWFPRKWFDEKFSQTAFGLAKGQISEVVQTEVGLHLIKVTDRNPGKPLEFNQIREAVKEMCAEDLRQQIIADERKARAAKIEIMAP